MTAAMTDELPESVRDRARRIAQTVDGPHDVAQRLLKELEQNPGLMRAALGEVLPGYCGDIIREDRNLNCKPPEVTVQPADRKGGPSSRVRAIREWHARCLAQQLHVDGAYKRIGDCTTSDLMFAVDERARQIKRTQASIAWLRRLAAALEEHKVTTVAELPADAVRDAMTGTE